MGHSWRKTRKERKIMMDTSNQTDPAQNMFSVLSGSNPELVANPFPLFAQLRSMSAVFPVPLSLPGMDGGAWIVTRMQEAVQVLKEHANFTVDPRSIGLNIPFGRNREQSSETPTFFTSRTMLTVDEPDHRRLRSLVSKAFTP